MALAYINKASKQYFSGMLVSFLLSVMLTACGKNPVNMPSSVLHPSSTEQNSTKAPRITPGLNASEITIDIGHLRIQSNYGFQCPNGMLGFPMDDLVLTSNRTIYSQHEIEQMRAYVRVNTNAYGILTSGIKPPPTLRWVLGGSMDPVPGTWPADQGQLACGAILFLTNTGSTPIQIPNSGVQLKENPRQNTYQYHLIDACSIIPKSDPFYCLPPIGGRPGCNEYTALIQLGIGLKDRVFSVTPLSAGFLGPNAQGTPLPCGALTIAPSAQIKLTFIFSLAPNVPQNITYSVIPELTEITAEGKKTLLLSQWAGTLTFAGADHFSCYGLQGTTFILEQSPVFSSNLWCM